MLAIGFNPALRISLKSYFKPLNFSIIWEVMGIGIPASVESVLFTSGLVINPNVRCRDGDQLLPEILSRSQLRLLSTYPKCARFCFYDHYRPKVGGRADSASRDSVAACVLAVHSGLTAIAWLTAPFAGVMASFYTQDPQVKHVVVILIWLNALFMPVESAHGCYPLI